MSKEPNMDIFEQQLKNEREKLKSCQQSKKFSSCFNCEKLVGCEVRRGFVGALYKSMNKGKDGGFNF